MSRRGFSRRRPTPGRAGRLLRLALLVAVLLGCAPAGLTPLGHSLAWAQTPGGSSSSDAPASQDSTPASPQPPSAPPSGGQQEESPATAPWTPPVAPPPSQSHGPGLFVPPMLSVRGATFEYHSTLTLSEQYNDNFNLTTSAQGKQSNFRTTLAPGSVILLNTDKVQGSLSASFAFTYDSSSSNTDNFQAFPSLSASLRYTYDPRLSFTVTDSFNRTDNPTVVNSTGLQQQRQTYLANTFGASVDWLIDLLQTQYYYRNSYFNISDTDNSQTTSTSPGQSTSNTLSQIFGVSASTRLGLLNTVRVGYEYSINEPQQGVTSYGNLGTASLSHQLGQYASVGVQGSYTTQTLDDLQIWNGSVFGTYGLPTGFSFSGSVGYSILDSNVTSNQSGMSGNATVTYALARGAITLGVFQDYRTTYQGGLVGQTGTDQAGQNFGVVQTLGVTGSFSYALTPFISSFLQASYSQNTNTGIGNNQSSPNENFYTANAGLTWALLRWLNLGLQYTFNGYNHPDRTQNMATVSLTSAF